MKTCTRCKVKKPLIFFSKATRETDGYQHRCKFCNSIVSAEYRAKNKGKEKLRHAKYHAENKDNINKRISEWQKNNKNKVREKAKRFYNNNKEKELARQKKWSDKNAEWKSKYAKKYRSENAEQFREYEDKYWRENTSKIYAKNAKRRAQRIQATPLWANQNIIMAIYEECITLSKETGIEHHVDHIVPLINNKVCGLHCEDNLQIITASENLSKCNKFNSGLS